MIVESTLPDGSYDRDWTALTVQTDHAVGVHLSSDTSLVRPGDQWPYTVKLQNVLGRPLSGSATWTISRPGRFGNDVRAVRASRWLLERPGDVISPSSTSPRSRWGSGR